MRWWWVGGLWMGCAGGNQGDSGTSADTSSPTTRGLDAHPLLEGLVGVWRDGEGALDLAVTESGWLFTRGDLHAGGYRRLRFGLTSDGAHLRDTSEVAGVAVDHTVTLDDHAGDVWRFCGSAGCADLQIDVEASATSLAIETTSEGTSTSRFQGMRLEDVPVDDLAAHAVDDPDPTLPTLTVEASWPAAETVATFARVVVSRTVCQTGCVPSRTYEQLVPSGATSVTLAVPELHVGRYYVTAFLDRNRTATAAQSYQVDAGDLFALPDQEVIVTGDMTLTWELSLEL